MRNGTPVEQYSLVTGAGLCQYDSVSDAAYATLLSRSGISKTINGQRRSCGGYGWRRLVLELEAAREAEEAAREAEEAAWKAEEAAREAEEVKRKKEAAAAERDRLKRCQERAFKLETCERLDRYCRRGAGGKMLLAKTSGVSIQNIIKAVSRETLDIKIWRKISVGLDKTEQAWRQEKQKKQTGQEIAAK